MKTTLHLLTLGSLLALGGCGASSDPPPVTPDAAPATTKDGGATAEVEKDVAALIALAKAIRANPGDTDKLLSGAGMTVGQFEAAMFQIAKDPGKAEAFAAALQ